MYKVDERYLLLRDAALLASQYESRNNPDLALNADQRKLWAAETVVVMKALAQALEGALPSWDWNLAGVYGEWNLAMREGRRAVTYKVPSRLAYGGLKLREPEFKDDPTDPRGKAPRHVRPPNDP